MESTVAKLCSVCCSSTKYRCITCNVLVCNRCAIAEEDEFKEGWIAGRQVGYCSDCNDQVGLVEREPTGQRGMQNVTAIPTTDKAAQGAAADKW